MGRNSALWALGLSCALLAGCAAAVPPVEVTRFHNGATTPSGTIAIEEAANNSDVSMEFRTYAAAVGQELQRIGFTQKADDTASSYVARVSFERSFRPTGVANRSPVSVGVGGSTGSYGSGIGLGIGINLSGKPKDIVTSTLSVQIRRRADNLAIWEGRASTDAKDGSPAAQPGIAAAKLASALFKDYPGQSGQTITVK